jgi:hypothetical protein
MRFNSGLKGLITTGTDCQFDILIHGIPIEKPHLQQYQN